MKSSRLPRPPSAAGGWPAIFYTLKKARQSGGFIRMWRALRSRNACKTCALGMGGQLGGMVNERGKFPEVCKKSVQAMAADMQGRIREGFFDEFDFHKLARFTPRELEHSGRLVEPLLAEPGDKTYRTISWDEAINSVADAMIAARSPAPPHSPASQGPAAFFYFSGRSSNEAAFLLQLLARVYGTNNVNNCSYFCHQASGVGLRSVTGSGTATVTLDDIAADDGADLVFIIGGNPASNHPRLMRTLIDVRRRGGKVIVINPLKELGLVRFKVPSDVRSMLSPRGSQIADEYIQPHIGGDIGLFAGMAKALLAVQRRERGETEGAEHADKAPEVRHAFNDGRSIEADHSHATPIPPHPSHSASSAFNSAALDLDFITNHTDNFDQFRAGIDALTWPEIEASSGVTRPEIEKLAAIYAASKETVFCWTMGLTHHAHGVSNVRMLAALAMLRGMLGRPGCGLLPLRGHSNVQGVGSMGVEPKLKWEVLNAMQDRFGITLPTSPGLDTLACVEAAARSEIRFAWHLGGNLFGSCPDSSFASHALGSIDTTVFLSTTLNTGHIHGRGKTSIILPVLARDEEPQSTTQESMFNYVRLSDGGRARYTGTQGPPLSEVEVMCRIFRKVLGDKVGGLDLASMQQHTAIREAIAATIPGYEPIARISSPSQREGARGRAAAAQEINDSHQRTAHSNGSRGHTPTPPTSGEFHIQGRTFHTPQFRTPSGRAVFHPVPALPQPPGSHSPQSQVPSPQSPPSLRLMTIRSEGQFNTVVYEEHDLYRGQERRDVILMSPVDIARLGFKPDDRVTVRSATGEMTSLLVRPIDIRPGNAAVYYPEANVLVPRSIDSESRTPSFKSVEVQVFKAGVPLVVLAS